MALVMNASCVEQAVQVHGSWFTFKPDQIKDMHSDKVFHLVSKKGEQGFVSLPDDLSDLDFRQSKEGQAMITAAKAQGIANRVKHLEWLRDNELVSLKRDLEQKNIGSDPRAFMSDDAVKALEELSSYKNKSKSDDAAKIARIKELEAALTEE